ncbi:hypothetical protein Dsin_004796 [Dipteronia sinensis]|uniref:RNase H type-1 domain-containing protein n=1 Tax=Dipteronia sinensis TaxID=43782 RepID=A0AAE0EEA7_9ROSI|nr:hypothetical protein Dsin_004796 [Dipteronia sinensis]
MKCISWNVRGLGRPEKRRAVSIMVKKCKPSFLFIQETKVISVDYRIVNCLGGGILHKEDAMLVNLPMQGFPFTWSNSREVASWARLDRFLVSQEFLHWFPGLFQWNLPISISDHSAVAEECERCGIFIELVRSNMEVVEATAKANGWSEFLREQRRVLLVEMWAVLLKEERNWRPRLEGIDFTKISADERFMLGDAFSMEEVRIALKGQIINNFVIANEVISSWRKEKKGGIVLKLDFEKAYDNVDHKFLDLCLQGMGFVKIGKGNSNVERWAELFRCKTTSLPIKYLGLPLGGRPSSVSFWEPMLDKIRARLAPWKIRFLSNAGRLVLIKSVLSSLPTYFMSVFQIPISVALAMEKLQRDFFWGVKGEKKGIHWVDWPTFYKSKRNGGLGIRRIQDTGDALLAKWDWKEGTHASTFINSVGRLWKVGSTSVGILIDCLKFALAGGRYRLAYRRSYVIGWIVGIIYVQRLEVIECGGWLFMQYVGLYGSLGTNWSLSRELVVLIGPWIWKVKCPWSPPLDGTLKFNVDGLSRGNLGPSGIGGIMRNSKGDILCMFSSYIGFGSSVLAEVQAILKACHLCVSDCCPSDVRIIIESDSMVVVAWVNGTSGVGNVSLMDYILDIKEIVAKCKPRLSVIHVSRITNFDANFLGKQGAMTRLDQVVWP